MSSSADPSSPASGDVQRLARGAGVQLGGKTVGRATGFLIQLLLARWLGPAVLGTYAIGLSLFMLLNLIASLGLDHGIIRYASRHAGDGRRLRATIVRALRVAAVAGAAGGAALLLAARPLALSAYQMPALAPVLALFSAGVLFAALLRVAAAGTRVSQKMGASTLTEDLGQPLLFLLLLLFAYRQGAGLLSVVGALVISYAGAASAALYLLRRLYRDPVDAPIGGDAGTPGSRELLWFSIAAAAASFLGLLNLWADRLLMGYFRTEAETGVYHAAALAATAFALILISFNAMFAPMIARLYHQGAIPRLRRLFRVSTKWGLYLCLPPFLTVVLFPQIALQAVFDVRFVSGSGAMVILVCGQMVNVATGGVAQLLIMSGHQNRWLVISVSAVATNVVLNLLWIPRFGLAGAAAATATSTAAVMLVAVIVVWRYLSLWPWDRRFVKGMVAAGVAAAALLGLRRLGLDPSLPGLLLIVAVSTSAFVATLAALGFDGEDRDLMRRIRSRTRGERNLS